MIFLRLHVDWEYIYNIKAFLFGHFLLSFLSMACDRLNILLFVIVFSPLVTSQSKEIIIDEERPLIRVDNHEGYSHESLEEAIEHAPCHMEYKVCIFRVCFL